LFRGLLRFGFLGLERGEFGFSLMEPSENLNGSCVGCSIRVDDRFPQFLRAHAKLFRGESGKAAEIFDAPAFNLPRQLGFGLGNRVGGVPLADCPTFTLCAGNGPRQFRMSVPVLLPGGHGRSRGVRTILRRIG